MAKVSKKQSYKKGRTAKGSSKLSKKKGASKEMKKGKKGGTIKKMMANANNKPRQVYCLRCKDKVEITNYKIKKNKRGTYQVEGECCSNACAQKPMRVFAFISAEEAKKTK